MEEKKIIKISLSTFFLILAIIVIIVMGIFMYKLYNDKTNETEKVTDLNNQISSLEITVNDLQETINTISDTITTSKTDIANNSQNNIESSSVSYIVLEIEDLEAEERNKQGLEYKNKKITNKQQIDSLMKIIDSATSYTSKSFITDFGEDCPPGATIYLSNGESYTIAAGDQISDNGEIVNLMTKWYSKDGSDKTLYKVNTELGKYIEKLFND